MCTDTGKFYAYRTSEIEVHKLFRHYDLKLEMLAEASKNARERAETITKNAGGKLGDLKTATTGVFQITAPNSADEDYSWGGAFNTSSKQKHVSINMRQTYYVK